MKLWDKIKYRAARTPERSALIDLASGSALTYGQLRRAVAGALDHLNSVDGKRVGLLIGNASLWCVYDLVLTLGGATVVPIPLFFSPGQIKHIMADANISLLVVESLSVLYKRFGERAWEAFGSLDPGAIIEADSTLLENPPLNFFSGSIPPRGDEKMVAVNPDRVIKIIYTSGTTGTPKGVMVKAGAIDAVMDSLAEVSKASKRDRHLSLLPLSTLLEAVGGLYLPLSKGASIFYPRGFYDADMRVDVALFADALKKASPTTLILVPVLLDALVRIAESGVKPPETLRYVACGGAPVSTALLKRAVSLGIPVYQGYGLSECTSVVAACGRGVNKIGSVGKPLKHSRVTIAEDGEVIVEGQGLMAGYATNSIAEEPQKWATGDIGWMDEDGFLYITGRKDDMLATAHGRNISPEWVEKELVSSGAVRQAFVVDNGQGRLAAIVVPEPGWMEKTASKLNIKTNGKPVVENPAIEKAMADVVRRASKALPEYAAVHYVMISSEPFSISNGLLTPNHRLKRKEIAKRHSLALQKLLTGC